MTFTNSLLFCCFSAVKFGARKVFTALRSARFWAAFNEDANWRAFHHSPWLNFDVFESFGAPDADELCGISVLSLTTETKNGNKNVKTHKKGEQRVCSHDSKRKVNANGSIWRILWLMMTLRIATLFFLMENSVRNIDRQRTKDQTTTNKRLGSFQTRAHTIHAN